MYTVKTLQDKNGILIFLNLSTFSYLILLKTNNSETSMYVTTCQCMIAYNIGVRGDYPINNALYTYKLTKMSLSFNQMH